MTDCEKTFACKTRINVQIIFKLPLLHDQKINNQLEKQAKDRNRLFIIIELEKSNNLETVFSRNRMQGNAN